MNSYKINIPTALNWIFWLMLFCLFNWWHGYFETPLYQDEINVFAEKLHSANPKQSIDEYKQMLSVDNGNPIYMVNVIKYYDNPVKDINSQSEVKAEKLAKNYNNYVGKFLIQRGSYPVFLGKSLGGTAASWGVDVKDSQGWSEAVIVRYRNIRTMLELATDEQFLKNLPYKHAALEKTIIYPTSSEILPGSLGYLIFFILLSGALLTQLIFNRWMYKSISNNTI